MTTAPIPPRRPQGRYDEPRTLPRPVFLGLVGLLAAGLVALLVLAWTRFESRGTSYRVLGYRVVSDTSVEVRFEVQLSPGATVRCDLRARDQHGAEVGHDRVQVGPRRTSPVVMTHVVTTRGRAVSGEVSGCSA